GPGQKNTAVQSHWVNGLVCIPVYASNSNASSGISWTRKFSSFSSKVVLSMTSPPREQALSQQERGSHDLLRSFLRTACRKLPRFGFSRHGGCDIPLNVRFRGKSGHFALLIAGF